MQYWTKWTAALKNKTSNLRKAYETRDSLLQFLFVGCRGQSPSISSKFTL